jgi:hypothetical protein
LIPRAHVRRTHSQMHAPTREQACALDLVSAIVSGNSLRQTQVRGGRPLALKCGRRPCGRVCVRAIAGRAQPVYAARQVGAHDGLCANLVAFLRETHAAETEEFGALVKEKVHRAAQHRRRVGLSLAIRAVECLERANDAEARGSRRCEAGRGG